MNKYCSVNLLLIAILQLMFSSCYTLKTLYVDQQCPPFTQKTIYQDLSRANAGGTSVVFKTSGFGGYPGYINCTIIFKSPSFGGFVFSFRTLKIREIDKIKLTNAEGIPFPLLTHGLSTFLRNFWISSDSMSDILTLRFTTGMTSADFNYKVELFFTTFSNFKNGTYDFRCANGKYIWSGFKCDGHYHCGDGSEQKNCGPGDGYFRSSRWFPISTTTTKRPRIIEIRDDYNKESRDSGIIVGCIVVVCLLVTAVGLLAYMKKRKNVVVGSVMVGNVVPPPQPYHQPSAPPSEPHYNVPAIYPQYPYPSKEEMMYPPPPPYTPKAEEN